DPIQTSASASTPRFRPYASSKHQVMKGRYITSNDPRGYIPVYEYPLNGQWIMMDIDDGYILWTGIWKALGNSKADIVKMIDSQPDLAPLIRRVRGGYLKIQGTWMPYEVALRLSRRVAWAIREDLVPLFGPTFPSTCLSPDQPGYGQVVATGNNRRRPRRGTQTTAPAPQAPREPSNPDWRVLTPNPGASTPSLPHQSLTTGPGHGYLSHHHSGLDRYQLLPPQMSGPASSVPFQDQAPPPTVRYSPYAGHPIPRKPSSASLSLEDPSDSERITLPPLRTPLADQRAGSSSYALPPISALEDLRGIHNNDSAAVLRRLRSGDELASHSHPHTRTISQRQDEKPWMRRHSLTSQSHSHSMDVSPKRHPSSLPTYSQSHGAHPYYEYHIRQHRRSSRPPSRACSSSHLSHEGDFSANNSTCEPSPVSPSTPHSILSSPGTSNRYREDNASVMTPLTVAADRINLDSSSDRRSYSGSGDENSATPSMKFTDNVVRQPLRPW
ncbi:Transcriptional repressor XBP1, partial [Leucoagaricus sp. SymC.cos]